MKNFNHNYFTMKLQSQIKYFFKRKALTLMFIKFNICKILNDKRKTDDFIIFLFLFPL